MSVDSAVYVDGHRTAESASLDETYEAYRSQEGVAWIGLYKPTAEEFELHPLAVENALDAHHRPKLERYGGTFFVVPKPVCYLDEVERVEFGEIHTLSRRTSSSPPATASHRTWAWCARASRPTPSSSDGVPRPSCSSASSSSATAGYRAVGPPASSGIDSRPPLSRGG
jgi:hypothetical protein